MNAAPVKRSAAPQKLAKVKKKKKGGMSIGGLFSAFGKGIAGMFGGIGMASKSMTRSS